MAGGRDCGCPGHHRDALTYNVYNASLPPQSLLSTRAHVLITRVNALTTIGSPPQHSNKSTAHTQRQELCAETRVVDDGSRPIDLRTQ